MVTAISYRQKNDCEVVVDWMLRLYKHENYCISKICGIQCGIAHTDKKYIPEILNGKKSQHGDSDDGGSFPSPWCAGWTDSPLHQQKLTI